MAATVGITGAFGFLASFLLLRLGVESMALRYPVAVFAAYSFFLALLALWVRGQRQRTRRSRDWDLPDDLPSLDHAGGGEASAEPPVGSGGHFGGGGASTEFSADHLDVGDALAAPPSAGGSGGIELPSVDVDLDEGCVVVLPVLVVAAGVLASAYVVWLAPTLFAEMMVDGVLVAAMYRRLGRTDGPTWLTGAVRRTWGPAAAVALTLFVLAIGMAHFVPEAHSMGAFWQAVSTEGR